MMLSLADIDTDEYVDVLGLSGVLHCGSSPM